MGYPNDKRSVWPQFLWAVGGQKLLCSIMATKLAFFSFFFFFLSFVQDRCPLRQQSKSGTPIPKIDHTQHSKTGTFVLQKDYLFYTFLYIIPQHSSLGYNSLLLKDFTTRNKNNYKYLLWGRRTESYSKRNDHNLREIERNRYRDGESRIILEKNQGDNILGKNLKKKKLNKIDRQ